MGEEGKYGEGEGYAWDEVVELCDDDRASSLSLLVRNDADGSGTGTTFSAIRSRSKSSHSITFPSIAEGRRRSSFVEVR